MVMTDLLLPGAGDEIKDTNCKRTQSRWDKTDGTCSKVKKKKSNQNKDGCCRAFIVVFHLLSHVSLFTTPWTAA